MESKKYIHYGHKNFDRNLFVNVFNERFCATKPHGGLWASAVDATWGWKDWCKENDFMDCTEDNSFSFHLAPTANVLVIDNIDCLEDLPRAECGEFSHDLWVSLDFEKLRDSGVDAIEYVLSADQRLYWALYGWDCDSILIMNPDIIVEEF
jgi:hypothetical protein